MHGGNQDQDIFEPTLQAARLEQNLFERLAGAHGAVREALVSAGLDPTFVFAYPTILSAVPSTTGQTTGQNMKQ